MEIFMFRIEIVRFEIRIYYRSSPMSSGFIMPQYFIPSDVIKMIGHFSCELIPSVDKIGQWYTIDDFIDDLKTPTARFETQQCSFEIGQLYLSDNDRDELVRLRTALEEKTTYNWYGKEQYISAKDGTLLIQLNLERDGEYVFNRHRFPSREHSLYIVDRFLAYIDECKVKVEEKLKEISN